MEKNILLEIEYDGTGFSGWQIQPEARTVQGEIEHVLTYIAGEPVHIHGTSRTDKGVHALGQCASFMWDNHLPTEKLASIMNRRFGVGGMGRSGAPGDIRIISAREMPLDFHARYSCIGKTYVYFIDREADIFNRNFAFQYPNSLDVEAMREAACFVTGSKDFKSFEASGGTPRETTVRTVSRLDIIDDVEEGIIKVEITGDGFLYNMVRIIVGTLIEVGDGRRTPESLKATIESRSRAAAGFTAPACGLYLKKIYF